MGYHGSIGNGADRARAACAAHSHGTISGSFWAPVVSLHFAGARCRATVAVGFLTSIFSAKCVVVANLVTPPDRGARQIDRDDLTVRDRRLSVAGPQRPRPYSEGAPARSPLAIMEYSISAPARLPYNLRYIGDIGEKNLIFIKATMRQARSF